MSARRILITGCSGAGKSTLLAELARRGQDTVKEPGRRVIRAETRMGGKGRPWENAERFAKLCLKMAIADWDGVRAGTVFYDRGVLDAALLLDRMGQADVAAGYLKSYPYDGTVVLAPPWENLFRSDPDRRQSFADAMDEYVSITEALARLGYEARLLPEAGVAERAEWVEDLIGGVPV